MNMQSTTLHPRPLALMVIALLYAGSSLAQAPMDTDRLPDPETDKAGCADVIWHTDLVQKYPRISSGCQEVVVIKGEKWARFEGDFVRNNNDGSFTSEFMTTNGRSLGNVTLMPTTDQRVTLDGRKYRFTELKSRQQLNFYIPEGASEIALEPSAPKEEYVQIVRFEEEPEPMIDERDSDRLAQVDPEPEPVIPRLPDTAGPLPLLAFGGVLSLFVGSGLTLRRRWMQRRNPQTLA